jgi:hypothetical protein
MDELIYDQPEASPGVCLGDIAKSESLPLEFIGELKMESLEILLKLLINISSSWLSQC